MEEEEYSQEFEGQHKGEDVQFVFRRHPLVMRKPLIFSLLVIALSTIPLLFWPLERWPLYVVGGAFLLSLIIMFYFWIGWYFSVIIVTTERILKITQGGLFSRQVTEISFDKIQNINYEISGFQATIFQFGTITVQTYVGDLLLDKVFKPATIHERLITAVREANVKPSLPFENNKETYEED